MAAAAPAVIGIAARIGGLGPFVSGLGQINTGLAGFQTNAAAVSTGLQTATTHFTGFNTAVTGISTSLNAVSTTIGTFTAPLRAVGDVLGDVAGFALRFSGVVVSALGEAASAATAFGVAAAIGIGVATTALAGGIGLAVGITANFHQELTDLAAITQQTPENINQVEEAVKRMATQFTISIPEIQRTALELVKAGVSTGDVSNGVLKVTLALQQLSKGELSAEQAGQGLGSLLTLFNREFKESGQSVEQFSLRIANAVTTVANNTRASIQEVINGINNLAPTLAARGQSFEDIFASLNVILSAGLRGEVGGTGLRNLFNFLTNPSKEALKTIKELGLQDISPFDLDGNIRPALDVLRSIQQLFSKGGLEAKGLTPAQGEQALGQIFQTRAATIAAIIRELGPEKIQEFFDTFQKTNLIDQASKQLETLNAQVQLLKNNAELAAIAFGSNFIGALTQAGKSINSLFSDEQGGPGPIRSGAGALGQGLASIISGSGQNDAFASVTQNLGDSAGEAFAAMFNQVDALRAPVEGLISNLGVLKDTVVGIVFPDGPEGAINNLGDALQGGVELANRFVGFLNENLPTAAKNFETLRGEAETFVGKIVDIITQGKGFDTILETWQSLQPVISNTRDVLDKVATSGAEFIKTIIENRDPLLAVFNTLVTVIGNIDRLMLSIATNSVRFAGAIGGISSAVGTFFSPELAFSRAQSLGRTLDVSKESQRNFIDFSPIAEKTKAPPISEQARDRDLRTATQIGPTPTEAAIQRGIESVAAFDAMKAAEAAAAAAGDDAADSITRVGAAANTTAGAINNNAEAAKAAEQALKSVARANDRLEEALEDAGRAQDQAFRQLERSLSGIEQRYVDTLESIAEATEDSFRQITEGAKQQRDDLNEAFKIREDETSRRDVFQTEAQERKKVFDRSLEDVRRGRQQDQEDELQGFSRLNEDKLRVFRQGEDVVARERQTGIDRDNTAFQRGQEDRVKSFTRAQETITRALSEGFENRNLQTTRDREDVRRREQLARDLAKASDPKERQSIQERFTEETRALKERRGDEDTDRRTRKDQEQQLLKLRHSQEDDLVGFRRSQDDDTFNRRLGQAEDEVSFRIGQELRFVAAQRVIQDAERDRRRLLEQRELLQRRGEEDTIIFANAQDEQARQRAFERQLATENLDRQLGQVDRREQEQLTKLQEQTGRRIASTNRTAAREGQSALTQYNDQLKTTQGRLADVGTDLARSGRNAAQEINKADPTGKSAEAQAALGQLQGINQAIAGAQAVLGAQAIIAESRGQQAVDSLTTRLGGLKSTADGALGGLLGGLQELQAFGETNQAMTITTVLNSPQAERLAIAMEKLADKIENVAPGTTIGEVNVTVDSAEDGASFVGDLSTVGGQ